MDAKIQHVVGLMLTFLSPSPPCLLVGFAPVVWLFSTSSNSIGILRIPRSSPSGSSALFLASVSSSRAAHCMGGGQGAHLKLWIIVFILVTLQMTTTLRPIIGKAGSNSSTSRKSISSSVTGFESIGDEANQVPSRSIAITPRRKPGPKSGKANSQPNNSGLHSRNPVSGLVAEACSSASGRPIS